MPGDAREAQSSHRFEELKARDAPQTAQEQPAKEAPEREQAAGRYAELTRDARDEAKSQEFGANMRAATEEKFGRDQDTPGAPMQKDAPSKEELTPPQHGGRHGGPQPTPGGSLWQQHGYRGDGGRAATPENDRGQDQTQDQQGGDREKAAEQKSKLWEHAYASTSRRDDRDEKERGDGKRLEFYEDRNPERDQGLSR